MKITKSLLANNINGYSDEAMAVKEAFHKDGKKFLKELANAINLEPGSYDIRSNKAGIAVSGEITLHGENIYVQLGAFGSPSILFRTCNGRKDFSGDANNSVQVSMLTAPERLDNFVTTIKRMIENKISLNEQPSASRRPRM